jgi:hypothetical protein
MKDLKEAEPVKVPAEELTSPEETEAGLLYDPEEAVLEEAELLPVEELTELPDPAGEIPGRDIAEGFEEVSLEYLDLTLSDSPEHSSEISPPTEGDFENINIDFLTSSEKIPQEKILENLTSEIEFSPLPEIDVPDDDIDGELEVVSPFETLFAGLDSDWGDDFWNSSGDIEASTGLEELSEGFGASYVYTPFLYQFLRDGVFEFLEAVELVPTELDEAETLEGGEAEPVIEVRDGINFIKEKFLKSQEETDQTLDPEMKNLINTVINRNLLD